MRKIYVNVLTDDVEKAKLFFDSRFNVVSDEKDFMEGRPVLILGWELAKKLYPKEVSILTYRIKPGVLWTFEPGVRTSAFCSTVGEILSGELWVEMMRAV